MKLFPDNRDTITSTARRLRSGETNCVDVFESCLDRIEEREATVRAWVLVDRDGALAQAQALDAELQAGLNRGPLHGIPIGIKDIIDVEGLPTGCGSPRAEGRPARQDATIVARLRKAGAVILGKTVTTAYAWIDPPVTRNPWNLDRTPGGSSSGSAAAVACGMCLGAIGTQTGGSITRPAAFCGVCGMKPTYGSVSTAGIQPLAPSLDHPGPIARSVGDLGVLYEALCEPGRRSESRAHEQWQFDKNPPRLGHLTGFFDDRAHAEMRWAIYAFLKWFEGCGAQVIQVPVDFAETLTHHRTILATEAYRVHRERFSLLPEAYPPRITELILEGSHVSRASFAEAEEAQTPKVSSILGLLDEPDKLDALVTPAALGPAPDPSTTGDPAFNSPWSYLGFPTVSFPIGFSGDGLPMAVQLIGGEGAELELLAVAAWCEKVMP
jgi:aspartyl-tRNA(Asn)/glutamyl-tRNA(Gln) amidotransferase subunit A